MGPGLAEDSLCDAVMSVKDIAPVEVRREACVQRAWCRPCRDVGPVSIVNDFWKGRLARRLVLSSRLNDSMNRHGLCQSRFTFMG
jgi:hypothetical protein